MVEWLALLFRMREVPASNLGPENDYPDRILMGVLYFSRQTPA
jgi:hypothetical protein